MSGEQESPRAIWTEGLAIWAGLMVLLVATLVLAYVPMGRFNGAVSMAIAALKAGLVVLFFMRLRQSPALMALAAAAGVFWLATLFAMTLTDYPFRLPGERIGVAPSERAARAADDLPRFEQPRPGLP